MVKEQGVRQAGKKRRREEILQAASKVFVLKGYNGATTAEIAKEAGVAEGTIFRYFPTKKDILLNLATTLALDTLQGVFTDINHRTDEELLKSLLMNRIRLIRPNIDMVKFLFYETQFHPEVRQVMFGEVMAKAVGMVSEYFRGLVAKGVFRDIDPLVAVRGLVGSVVAYFLFESGMQGLELKNLDEVSQEEKDRRNIELIVDVFLNGVRRPKGEE